MERNRGPFGGNIEALKDEDRQEYGRFIILRKGGMGRKCVILEAYVSIGFWPFLEPFRGKRYLFERCPLKYRYFGRIKKIVILESKKGRPRRRYFEDI